MAGNFPAGPGQDDFTPDDEARLEPQPTHGQLGGDKPPPSDPGPPPRGEFRGTDKPPPAEPPPTD